MANSTNSPRIFRRFFEFDRAQLNEADRTVPVAFSSEHPVDRGEYDEILDHCEGNLDLSRLKDSAAVLLNHDLDKQIGVVASPELSADKKGRALIRFGRSSLANEIFQDVVDGIRRHMSVGYERIKTIASETTQAGRRCVRFAWRPYELSVVSVPADPNVGVGRGKEQTRTQGNDECVYLCRDALSATNKALGAIESHGEHGGAIGPCRDVIAALAITIDDVNFWSEATAAECVDVCAECAGYCDAAVSALRPVAACAQCGDASGNAVHELEEAAECCRKNAGLSVKDAAMATEGTLEAAGVAYAETRTKTSTPVDTTKSTVADARTITIPIMPDTTTTPAAGTVTPPINVESVRNDAMTAERNRVRSIRAAIVEVSKNFPEKADAFRSLADAAVESGQTSEAFNAELLTKHLPGVRQARMVTPEEMGMSEADVNRYSLGRAIRSALQNWDAGRGAKPSGFEGEVHERFVERQKSGGGAVLPAGFWVPPFIMMSDSGKTATRDLNVTTAGQGGNFVQTSIVTPIIEILRNRMVTKRLGIQTMAGLEGNIAIPRQTGAATAYSLAESATLTKATQAIDQILLTPHRVGAYGEYTKQLLLQSSVDVENFIRDDLMKVMAIKWDKLVLEGQGAGSDPTGILGTAGIGSVTFGGAATLAKVVEFETSLALANADLGKMAYVTTPGVRGKWKVTPKIGTTFPIFLWEKGEYGNNEDGSNDGEVNAYRAAATNQISNNAVCFGNFADVILALWGGLDVVVNPYSRDIDGVVRITINSFGDIAVRHSASFCWSSDAGNQ